jgi:hypothetical protein
MYEFNVNEVEDYNDTIKDGIYPVVITEGEIRPSKNNPNTHLVELCYQIDGSGTEFDGYTVRDYFIIAHAEQRWAKKGKSDLKGLMIILGLKSFRDPSELCGQRLQIKTKVNKEGFANVYDRMKLAAPNNVQAEPTLEQQGIPF